MIILKPGMRKLVIGVAYVLVLYAAHWFAYQLRFDFSLTPGSEPHTALLVSWIWEIPIKLVLLYAFGQFSGLMAFFSLPDLKRVFLAMFIASLILFVLREAGPPFTVSRSILLSDFLLSIAGLASLRLAYRISREGQLKPNGNSVRRRVGIVGAGDAGATLALELLSKPGLGLIPAVFFDDDKRKWKALVHGIPVVGSPNTITQQYESLALERIIIAMPSAPPKRIREISEVLARNHIHCETVPGLDQLATGTVKLLELRPIQISDLLGRETVEIDHGNIQTMLQGKVVAVTGAGGSIGEELCRQILQFNPSRLLVIERSEVQLFSVEQELTETKGETSTTEVVPLVADVSDPEQIESIIRRHRPQVLYHAAAHKHVPIMERQPLEALRNNALGTAVLAEVCRTNGVEKFVLISTDKAINPTSVMGLSKRLSEIYIQALQAETKGTHFMAVRFGNVLGSSGSVIPVFQRQIAKGGPVTVTHPEVSRYFMTVSESVALVLQASALGEGGEIFMLDMGQPVKIVDLARQLIMLQGLRPETDIAIKIIGLRPGEKLTEDIRNHKENTQPTKHPKILRYTAPALDLGKVRRAFEMIKQQQSIPVEIHDLVPEYRTPELSKAKPHKNKTKAAIALRLF